MIVADTNLVGYLFLEGVHTPLARDVLKADPEWHVPLIWSAEFLNVLVTSQRFGGLSSSTARELFRGALALVGPRQQSVGWELTLDAAAAHATSAYDGEFIALAKHLALPLVTFDQKLQQAAPGVAQSPADFLASR